MITQNREITPLNTLEKPQERTWDMLVRERERWFSETMHNAGLRNTPARRLLREQIARAHAPLSIQEIFQRSGELTNITTIYRAVQEMQRLGLIHRVEFGEGFARYEAAALPGTGRHRQYRVCVRCGNVEEIAGDILTPELTMNADLAGFQVERHTLTIFGICADCLGE